MSDTHLWSQTYDRDLDDVFAIQDDIARQITAALEVKLLPQAMPDKGTENIEAYEYFFRGRSYFNRQGQKNLHQSVKMFEQAIERDPGFSRAWAALALARASFVLFFNGDSEELAAADAASRKAIELDPTIADGFTARIMVAGARSDYDEADAAFRKAVTLDPDNFEAHYHYGRHLIKRGDLQQAVTMFNKAREIDPYDFRAPILCMAILRDQDQQQALQAARDGIRNAEIHLEQHPDNARAYMLTAGALHLVGEEDRARLFIESALRIDADSEDTQYNAACFYARSGETDKALDCLERGMHDPDWIEHDADLDSLREHPRFKELLRQRRGNRP